MADVKSIIDSSRVTSLQIGVIAVCMIMNMLDGMDVVVISYAAPSLSKEWGIPSTSLGYVFSAALLGMALGAAFLAPRADTIGRRKIIIICILIMGGGVSLTAFAQSVPQLFILRFITGLGVGAMLASTVTLSSEYAPDQQKNFVVGIVLAGYPIGATLCGLVAAQIIPEYGWRTMFTIAGIITISTLPLAVFLLAESWDWLIKKQPANALIKLNIILNKMGQPPVNTLPDKTTEAKKKPGVKTLFIHGRSATTLKYWIAFFMGFASLYFMITWIPNLAHNTGLSIKLAIYAGTVFNLGSIFGNLSQGYLSQIIGLRKSIILYYLMSMILMILFGYLQGNWAILITFGLIGFGLSGGLIGLWITGARIYPTEIRSTGLGWAEGAGRSGAIISPTFGGMLVGAGFSLAGSFMIFVVLLATACLSIGMMPSKELKGIHSLHDV